MGVRETWGNDETSHHGLVSPPRAQKTQRFDSHDTQGSFNACGRGAARARMSAPAEDMLALQDVPSPAPKHAPKEVWLDPLEAETAAPATDADPTASDLSSTRIPEDWREEEEEAAREEDIPVLETPALAANEPDLPKVYALLENISPPSAIDGVDQPALRGDDAMEEVNPTPPPVAVETDADLEEVTPERKPFALAKDTVVKETPVLPAEATAAVEEITLSSDQQQEEEEEKEIVEVSDYRSRLLAETEALLPVETQAAAPSVLPAEEVEEKAVLAGDEVPISIMEAVADTKVYSPPSLPPPLTAPTGRWSPHLEAEQELAAAKAAAEKEAAKVAGAPYAKVKPAFQLQLPQSTSFLAIRPITPRSTAKVHDTIMAEKEHAQKALEEAEEALRKAQAAELEAQSKFTLKALSLIHI